MDPIPNPNPYSSLESNSPLNVRASVTSDSVMWFSGTGFVLLFMAQAIGLSKNGVGGSILEVSFVSAMIAAAYSFLATLLYLFLSLLLPRGATISTRVIAAIAFFGGLVVSARSSRSLALFVSKAHDL